MSPESEPTKGYEVYKKRNEHLIRYLRRVGFVREGDHVLDFGSGVGHIVQSLKGAMDVEVTCVEAGTAYHARLERIGCRVLSSFDEMTQLEQYDSVLLIEVLEHLADPVSVLRHIRKHLKAGKKIFVTTPAGDLRRPVAEPYALGAYSTPYHIQFFTPRSLCCAFRLAGFRRAYYRYVHELYPDDAMDQSDYESWWAKKNALKRQLLYWLNGSRHLTYFAK